MKLKSLIALTLIIVLGAGISFAQPPSGTMPPMNPQAKGPHPWMIGDDFQSPMKGMGKFLKLTDDQQTKIEKMKLDHKRSMLEMKSETAGLHEKIKLLITSDNFKQKEVDKIVDKLSDARAKHIKAKIKHMRSVREILTPEQQIKFDSHVLSGKHGGPGMGHGMHQGHGKGHRGPRGKKGKGCR